ncbi:MULTISPECIES: GDSL-type esterase/lipase family protein [unclassified Arenibacter]|jgi:lysophospholipase L1-like esterase|uniref:GDSL-type esterase/lipase family protein n=1 Tax=unclassified Arenibacter TaxID=2615047 RepID=UPI000E352E27|nr:MULTISPECIES: GDSL-type esterase/lipase family protein [unclassified Arenibacter]MCM4162338.1 sialate O-acetylesterase [Arenibacter sp. A80]RFT57936.1 sialate O-acetylesterase [Arenibacter sp. P308M17]
MNITKILHFTFIFLLGTFIINGQEIKIDTTYRPKTYDVQVRQFKSYLNQSTDIIFLGNSITARAHWNELLRLPNAKNRGISGDTTFGILERLNEITEGHPAKIFLLIGINDISRNFPDSAILANYESIMRRIGKESPNTKLYIETILPVNSSFGVYNNHYNKDQHILNINNGIKKLAQKHQVTLIDLYSQFLDEEERLNAIYTDEGLHLNEKGYEHWAKILEPYIAH